MSNNSLHVFLTGDYCPIGPIERLCAEHDWNGLFGDVLPVLLDKDISIVNLECPLTDKARPISKTGPNLIAPASHIETLNAMGADVAALANNHILDQGAQGCLDTIETCLANGIATVGAGANNAAATTPLILEQNGLRLAVINVAENEWSTTWGDTPGAAPLDPVKNARIIRQAAEKTDAVLVIVHGGHELYSLPSPRMVRLYRFFVEMGAAAVIGHHTHVVGPWEVYRGAPIYYSLGNFVFPWTNKTLAWRRGMLVRLTFRRGEPVDHEHIHIEQNESGPLIRLLSDKENRDAEVQLEALNDILSDDSRLHERWERWCKQRSRSAIAGILGLNRWQRALYKRRLWKPDRRRLQRLLNIIRCEAHRDVLQHSIEMENK
ncbi:MAG: CapA family protein [Candidatus Cloacimonetes bacterium]|nr:CapA family protein [Candidatus Cloacimonadota bacterium]